MRFLLPVIMLKLIIYLNFYYTSIIVSYQSGEMILTACFFLILLGWHDLGLQKYNNTKEVIEKAKDLWRAEFALSLMQFILHKTDCVCF